MKTRKGIAILSAAVMSLCAMPMASVNAADAAVPGDVDGDGVLTGHDAAIVSRYLLKGDIELTDAQLKIADVNRDDMVDQTDADWIFENKVYGLGGVSEAKGGTGGLKSHRCAAAFVISGRMGAGLPVTIRDEMPAAEQMESFSASDWFADDNSTTQLQYNLLDVDGDGDIKSNDICYLLNMSAFLGAGYDLENVYFKNGQYFLG